MLELSTTLVRYRVNARIICHVNYVLLNVCTSYHISYVLLDAVLVIKVLSSTLLT